VRGKVEVEALDSLDAVTERKCAGNDGACRGSTDEVEVVAEADARPRPVGHGAAAMFRKDGLDAFEERERERAAHTAAVKRQNSFRSGTEQMPIPSACKGLGHRTHPTRRSDFGYRPDCPTRRCHARFLATTAVGVEKRKEGMARYEKNTRSGLELPRLTG